MECQNGQLGRELLAEAKQVPTNILGWPFWIWLFGVAIQPLVQAHWLDPNGFWHLLIVATGRNFDYFSSIQNKFNGSTCQCLDYGSTWIAWYRQSEWTVSPDFHSIGQQNQIPSAVVLWKCGGWHRFARTAKRHFLYWYDIWCLQMSISYSQLKRKFLIKISSYRLVFHIRMIVTWLMIRSLWLDGETFPAMASQSLWP